MNGIARKRIILFFLLTLLVGNRAIAQQAAPDLSGIRDFARWRSGVGGLKGGKIKMAQKFRGTPEAHKKALEKIPQSKKFDASKQQAVKPKTAAASKVPQVQTAQDILLKKAPTNFKSTPSTVSARQAAFKSRMAGYRGRFKKSKFATDIGAAKKEATATLKATPKMALTSLKPSVPKRLQKKVLTKKERKALTKYGRGKALSDSQQQTVAKLKSAEDTLMDAYYQGAELSKKQLKMVTEIQKAETKQSKLGAPKRFFKRKGTTIAGTAIQEYQKHKEGLPQLAKDYAKIRKAPTSFKKLPGMAVSGIRSTKTTVGSLRKKSFSLPHRYKTSKKQMKSYLADAAKVAETMEKQQAAQLKLSQMSEAQLKSPAGQALTKELEGYEKKLGGKSLAEQDLRMTAGKMLPGRAAARMGKEGAMASLKDQAKMGFGYGGMKSRLKSAAISGATQALGSAAQIGIQQGVAAFTKKYESRPEKRDKFVKPQFDPIDDDIVIESK